MEVDIHVLSFVFLVLSVIMNVKCQSGSGSGDQSGSGSLDRATPSCAARVDVIFVVQGSSSVGASNFELLRHTLAKITRYLALDPTDGFSIAVIVYSTQSELEIPFTSDRESATGLCELLNYPDQPGVYLADALSLMRAIFASNRGNTLAKIGVVISSSASSDAPDVLSNTASARAEGIKMIAVGLGQSPSTAQVSQINAIGEERTLFYTSYQTFYDDVDILQDAICDGPDYCSVSSPALVPNPRDCHSYLQCTDWPSPLPAFIVRPCSLGLFFNTAKQSCDYPVHVRCLTDPCDDTTFVSYPSSDGCSSFWTCSDGRTTGQDCCDTGEAFIDGEGCDTDPSCTDLCARVPPPVVALSPAPGCDRQALADIPEWYMELGQLFSCPVGNVFNPSVCDCVLASTMSVNNAVPSSFDLSVIRGNDCTAEVLLTFDGGIQNSATAASSPWVNPGSVTTYQTEVGTIDGHSGLLNGQDDRLTVPFYTNTDLGGYVHVFLRLKESTINTDGQNIEGLFSNSYCSGIYPSIELFLDRSTQDIVAYISTSEDAVTIRTHFMPRTWKEVTLRYDKGNSLFLLNVDGNTVSSSTPITGDIRTINCGAVIGHSLNKGHFQGHIDTASIYRGCLPTFPYV